MDQQNEEVRAYESQIVISQDNLVSKKKKKDFVADLIKEVYEEENPLVQNLFLVPLKTSVLFIVTYLENPLMKTRFRFIMVALSFVFIVHAMEIFHMNFIMLFSLGLLLGFAFLILELVGVKKLIIEILYEIFSVFGAIGFISIFAELIIDFVTFLAFYFNIEAAILNALLLSFGNGLGDLFGNMALAKAGQGLMGSYAVYSGEIFNVLIGYNVAIMSAMRVDNEEFDIFGLRIPSPLPMKYYFFRGLIVTLAVLLVATFLFFFFNGWKLNKKMAYFLLSFYVVYFLSAMMLGIMLRE